jgi:cobaltochelatase CobN
VVPNHLFDVTHDALIADEAVLAAMIAANSAGAAAIAVRLRDALNRGLWVARRNAVTGELDRAIARSQGDRSPSMEAAK